MFAISVEPKIGGPDASTSPVEPNIASPVVSTYPATEGSEGALGSTTKEVEDGLHTPWILSTEVPEEDQEGDLHQDTQSKYCFHKHCVIIGLLIRFK